MHVCARAIIRSNLTYPSDDSMGTSDRLKKGEITFSPSGSHSASVYLFERLKKRNFSASVFSMDLEKGEI